MSKAVKKMRNNDYDEAEHEREMMAENIQNDDVEMDEEPMTIFDLNSDCLNMILCYLTFHDILKLAVVSDFFKYDVLDWTDFSEHFSDAGIDLILARIGRYLEIVTYTCRNLTIIPKHFSSFNYFAKKHLSHAELHMTADASKLTAEQCRFISTLEIFTKLNLIWQSVRGKYLCDITTLKELNILSCLDLQSRYFIKMCRNNKFKTLSILSCTGLNTSAIQELVSTQDELEEFEIGNNETPNLTIAEGNLKNLRIVRFRTDNCRDLLSLFAEAQLENLKILHLCMGQTGRLEELREKICKFRNLTELCVIGGRDICDDEFLEELVLHCVNLERVLLPYEQRITSKGVIGAIKNSNRLNYFDLTHSFIAERDYQRIVECLRNPAFVGRPTVTICARETLIDPNFKKTDDYQSKKSLVKLSYAYNQGEDYHYWYW